MRVSKDSRQSRAKRAAARGATAPDGRRRLLISGGSVTLVLAVWQVVGSTELIPSDLISYPSELVMVSASMVASGGLLIHFLVSLQELLYGFVPAVLAGMLLGLLMGHYRRFRYLLDPLCMGLYTTPRIALLPVLILWFGVGIESKVAVVFLGGVFPVLVNTMAGVRQIERSWIRAAQSLGASGPQVIAAVTLPGALPAIMTGIRLGFGRAIMGVIVGEMYVSTVGVGQLINVYGNAARAAELIVLATVIAAFGVLCVTALRFVEEWMGVWARQSES